MMWITERMAAPGAGWLVLVAAVLLTASPWAQAQVLSGSVAGDKFGWSVARAGDVNNDGFDDLLVGVPESDAGGQDSGEVLLYLGADGGYPSTPVLSIPGQNPGDFFGYAVSTAGDVNNDGYDDFLVGAPGYNAGGLDGGRAYLFLGSSSPNGTLDDYWEGGLPQSRFGAAVTGGLNFNGDNYADFAVGAPDDNSGGLKAGRVKVYLGAAQGSAAETFVVDGDQANWRLGFSLDAAGDLNNDGYDELAAGAPQTPDNNSGRVVVWFGQESETGPLERLLFSGEVGGDRFGWDVSGAGDLDGNGYDDLLVGAPEYGSNHGAVYIFDGGSAMNTTRDWRAVGSAAGNMLGTAVDGGFDLNGDETPDFAAGAPGSNLLASDAGEVRIYHGSGNPTMGADSVWLPQAPTASFEADDAFGTSVQFVGSLLGEGGSGLAAGAPEGNTSQGIKAGYVNLFLPAPVDVPVLLRSLSAVDGPGGVELRWDVSDDFGYLGFRVEAAELGRVHRLHVGWLASTARNFVDPEVTDLERVYRLFALRRDGSAIKLGEIAYRAGNAGLLLSPLTNPFHEALQVRVATPGGLTEVTVLDVLGRQVRTLWSGVLPPGSQLLTWDGLDDRGRPASPGVYLIRSRAGGRTASAKVVRH